VLSGAGRFDRWRVYAGMALVLAHEATATNGLGWERALEMFDYSVVGEAELDQRMRCRPQEERAETEGSDRRLVSDEALQFFELNELIVTGTFAVETGGRYAIDCIRDGYGVFRGPWGEQYVRRGETYVVPASLGDYEIRSEGREPLRILRARPPR
jgi:mannose-6-phosphate isomerase class I